MRLTRKIFLAPLDNGFYAVSAIAVSIFVFAYSVIFGQVSIVLYYLIWLPLFLLDYRLITNRPLRLLIPFAFAGLMIFSFLWSNAPNVSLRGGGQFFSHLLCALAAARVVSLRSLVRGFLVGIALVVLYSLAFGSYGYDAVDGSYTFVGAFGSKNQIGLYCSLGVYFGLVHLIAVRDGKLAKLCSIALTVLFVGTLAVSRSATSFVTLGIAVLLLLLQVALLQFRPRQRVGLFVFALPLAAAVAVAFATFGSTEAVLGVFGKDSTLTGRTYLWQQGIETAMRSPVLGVGYQAYWVQGFSEPERLWAEFGIQTRTGFHFHSTFIELFVELGYVGLALAIAVLATVLVRAGVAVVSSASLEAACYFALFMMLLVRAFTEVDCLYPFTIGSFVLFFLYFSLQRRSASFPRLSSSPSSGLSHLEASAYRRANIGPRKIRHTGGEASPAGQ